MKKSTKQLWKRLLPVIALFLAINIGFGIEYYLRIPKEWYTSSAAGVYNTMYFNPFYNATAREFAIDTSTDHAYVTAGTALLILDFENINSPTLLSSFNKTTAAHGVAYDDDTLILTGLKDFNVIDISNPSSPQNMSVTPIHENYTITDVELIGDLAYLSVAGDNLYVEPGLAKQVLYIVNVSDPVNPTVITVYRRLEFFATDIYIRGDILYLSQDDWGVRLIDISNASHPVGYSPGYYSAFGLVTQLRQYVDIQKTAVHSVDGSTYIFVADAENGYIIGDVTNPDEPQVIDGELINDVVSLHLTYSYAFVLRDTGQTWVYSLEKPTKFRIVGKFDPYAPNSTIIAKDIFVHQATSSIFILRSHGLAIFHLIEGVKNDYYREESAFSYTWIAVGLSALICVPLAISVAMRSRDKYAYST